MSLIKDSSVLKEALLKRLKELYPTNVGYGFRNNVVVKDANERDFKIAAEQLSRYFSDKTTKNSLSEAQIQWLCVRYGIPVFLTVGVPVVMEKDSKLVIENVIPKFNEGNSLERLKKVYNNG